MTHVAPTPPEPTSDQPAEVRAGRRRTWAAWARRAAWGLVAAVVALLGVLALLLGAALSPWGTRVVLQHVPGLTVVQPQGSLLRDFSARRVEYGAAGASSALHVVIDDLTWRGLLIERVPEASSGWGVALDSLSARSVVVRLPPSAPQAGPARLPTSLALPLGVRVQALRLGSLRVSTIGPEPITDVQLRLRAQHREGQTVRHRVDELRLHWHGWQASGSIAVASAQPFGLDAALALQSTSALQAVPNQPAQRRGTGQPEGDHSVHVAAQLSGTLAHLTARATAQARGQQAQLRADLSPFADWPVQQLDVAAQHFNLALFDARAPQTLLSGELHVQPPPSALQAAPARSGSTVARASSGSAAPRAATDAEPLLDVRGAWRNDAAGRWSDGRLPLRAVQWAGQVAARDGRVGRLTQLHAELGSVSAKQPGGQVQARGHWGLRACGQRAPCGEASAGWSLSAVFEQLRLTSLDAAAPPFVISGPLDVNGDTLSAARLGVQAELTGRVDRPGPARAVVAKVQAAFEPGLVRVQALQAQAGAATLTLQGSAQRMAADNAAWRVRAQGTWRHFDPQLWWPALFADAAAPNAGASSSDLNGELDADLTWRAAAEPGTSLAAVLASLGGEAHVQVERSRLRGVPLAARLQLGTPARSAHTTIDAALELADNRLSLQGRWAPQRAEQDQWRLDASLRDLRQLAPLAPWLQLSAMQGAVDASLQAAGRWPDWRTDGRLQVRALVLGWQAGAQERRLALDNASADWHWGAVWADASAPTQTRLDLDGLRLSSGLAEGAVQGWQVSRLHAQTTGAVRDHHASLTLDAVLPPAWATALQPLLRRTAAQSPLKIAGQFELQGQAQVDARQSAWSWRGQWQRGLVQPDASSVAGNSLGDQPWLRVEPFETSWSHGPGGSQFAVTPTRVSAVGAALMLRQLRWSSAQAGSEGPGGLDLEVDLEPVPAARVLAVWQPDMGWGGDLTVGGSLRVHRGAGAQSPLSLDAELARRSGDLTLTDAAAEGGAVMRLRLDALRLALSAHDGVWQIDHQITGRRLGSLGGQLRVLADAAAPWPDAHAPVDGQLNIDIADLRLWGLWVPPGWRLSGALQGQGAVKGTLQQPLISGQLKGRQLGVRNVLEGVDFDRGELDVSFQGSEARLNGLSLHAGAGSLLLSGDARLDVHPEARLNLVLQRFAVLQRVDRRLVVSGQAELGLQADGLSARGQFAADEGLFDVSKSGAPTLDEDVRRAGVDDDLAGDQPGPGSSGRTMRQVLLDVLLDLGPKLRLRGYGLDTRLAGQLKLTSAPPTYKPMLRGTIKTEGGTFAAYGQKLVIDRGAIHFNGPPDNPGLDIEATRPQSRMASSAALTATTADADMRVGVTITGTAQNPRIRLFSDPEMPDTDKLSWLILGHAASGLGGADVALLQGAASALLGDDASSLSGGLIQAIGLDEMSVRQTDTGSRDTVLTVGKQLSQRWYLGYERGLNATAGTWQLIYRLAQRFTVRAQTGLDNSLDLIWVWRWD